MRRSCQVYLSESCLCEEPAVDYVQIDGPEPGDGSTKVWLCALHWDDWSQQMREKGAFSGWGRPDAGQ